MSGISPYARKVWIGVGIAALVGVTILLAEAAITLLLVVFAGVVLAVYLRGLATLLERRSPLGRRTSFAAVILAHLLVLVGLVVYAMPLLETQVVAFADQLPEAVARV